MLPFMWGPKYGDTDEIIGIADQTLHHNWQGQLFIIKVN